MKRAPAGFSAFSAPAALGAPPPDNSSSTPAVPAEPVFLLEGSASSAPSSWPDFGIDRRLVGPSLTVSRDREERSLRSLSRVPVESQPFSFNSSGMLNQTGQVDRHIFPSSLPLSSRISCVPAFFGLFGLWQGGSDLCFRSFFTLSGVV